MVINTDVKTVPICTPNYGIGRLSQVRPYLNYIKKLLEVVTAYENPTKSKEIG